MGKSDTPFDQINRKFSLSKTATANIVKIIDLELNLEDYSRRVGEEIEKHSEDASKEIEEILKKKLRQITVKFTEEEYEFLYKIFIKGLPGICIRFEGWRLEKIEGPDFELLSKFVSKYKFTDIRSLLKTINASMDGLVIIEPEFSQGKNQYEFLFTLFE